jgi:hypothetical protein
MLRHCECFGLLFDQLKVNGICDIVQDYSHEIQNKSQLFDGINIKIANEIPSDYEKLSLEFPNGFYFHSIRTTIITNTVGDIIDRGVRLFLLLRFNGYKLQKYLGEMNALWSQQFPLLKTFSRNKRLCVFNDMENNNKQKRGSCEKVPESFDLLCDKIHSSILQWYIDKPLKKLFH